MRTYSLLIDGKDAPGLGWTYVIRASAFIDDPEGSIRRKRDLELGVRQPDDEDPGIVARCAWGGREDNEAAIGAAHRAAQIFSRSPIEVRAAILRDICERLRMRAAEFVDILVAEGHPRRLAEWELSGCLRGLSAQNLESSIRQLRQEFDVGSRRLLLNRKPDGVVCVNPPNNAAASNAGLGILALLAGNTLVVKAPRACPTGVMFLYREIVHPVLIRHGAPSGTLNLISGPTQEILAKWVSSPLVNDVLFFGASDAGLRLGAECLTRGKKPILELAGNDGLVVWRDADLEGAAEALLESFYGSGQICMVPKYAIVHPSVADAFLARFIPRVLGVKPGYPEDPATLLSPVLKVDKFFEFLAQGLAAGAHQLTGGRRVNLLGHSSLAGFFIEPTVLRIDGLSAAREVQCVTEETFFPLLPIVVPDSMPDEDLFEAVINFVNANAYGLRNSLWSQDPALIDRFVADVSNGGLLKVNESHIDFVPLLPTHGGTGRTGGPLGELTYFALRTTHLQGVSIQLRTDPSIRVSGTPHVTRGQKRLVREVHNA